MTVTDQLTGKNVTRKGWSHSAREVLSPAF